MAHEELIPDAEKKDFRGLCAMSHIHTSKWDILLALRGDNRNISNCRLLMKTIVVLLLRLGI